MTMNNNIHMLVYSVTQDKPFDYLKFLSEKTNLHSNTHPRYLYKKCSNDKDKVLCAQQEAEHLAAVWRNTFGGIGSFPSLTDDWTRLSIIDNYYKAAYASIDRMHEKIEQGEVDRTEKRAALESELYGISHSGHRVYPL
jgi:hypothetical protein